MRNQWCNLTSRSASPRIVTANAWAPVFPDWPATTGNSPARAVKRAMVSSKRPTTEAAKNAVARLICSQGEPLAHGKSRFGQGPFFLAHADHGLNIRAHLLLGRGDQSVVANHAEQTLFEIDDGKS